MIDGIWIALIVIGVLFLSVLIWYIGTMNTLRQKEVKVEEAESGIDVALTKRFDVLSKMVNTVKGYAKHEAETFEKVVKWRAGLPKELSLEQKQEFQQKMDAVQSGINVAVEAYPDLKAEKVFTNLQRSISDVEEHLQAARRLYNSNVSLLNKRIVTFPTSIVAGMIGMSRKAFFEAEASKRADVDISF
ncbi:MAG: LemA family protein [Acholeplasmatales bacterium]|nr:MAG: LemA family protein [Acholeplasmatales bacterium]